MRVQRAKKIVDPKTHNTHPPKPTQQRWIDLGKTMAKKIIKINTQYGPKPAVNTPCPGVSRTKQSFQDECNINKIMLKYQMTGAISHVNNHGEQYGFATSDDFLTSQNIVIKAQAMFDDLPSSIRSRFSGNPEEFLEFVQNPENAEEMAQLGLTNPPAEPDVVDVAKPAPPTKTEPEIQLPS